MVSIQEPRRAQPEAPAKANRSGFRRGRQFTPQASSEIMESNPCHGLPDDVLVVEDDAIIALGFEDTILGFGVKAVRTAGNVARALELIADRAPDFALLDVGLVNEKSFAVAERLEALSIPFIFITAYGRDVRLPPAFANHPRLPKPCSSEALEAALRGRANAG
jgi:CheY-like chemotaxis protein